MQKQILKCCDARHLIHLAVGDDTFPDEEVRLTDHLHVCSECRAYHAGMMDAMHSLEGARAEHQEVSGSSSLWPGIAAKLKVRPAVPRLSEKRRFSGAVVALCACSLMLALVTLVQNLPTNGSHMADVPSAISAMNVHWEGSGQPYGNTSAPIKLIEVPGPDGSKLWIDPVTNRAYVPSLVRQPAVLENDDLNF